MKNKVLQFTALDIHQYVVIGIFAFGCYFNSVFGTFVFDDIEAIVKNKDVLLTTPLSNVFANDFWGTKLISNLSHKSYRPLTILSYRFNVFLTNSELSPLYFHVLNVILYVILCLVSLPVFRLFSKGKPSKNADVAFLSCLLFTVHPVHTEVVASIVGRADILAALLVLTSFLLYDKAITHKSYLYLYCALILIAAATLCKETAIMGLTLCCVYDFICAIGGKSNFSSSISEAYRLHRFTALVLTGLFTMYFRFWIMNFGVPKFTSADNPSAFSSNVFTKTLTYNYIYFINFVLLVWPEWLCFDWSMGCIPLIEKEYDVRVLFVVLFWCICIVSVFKVLKKVSTVGICSLKPIILGTSFIILPFLPASNLFLKVGFVIAERILLIPSLGFCFLVALGFKKLLKKLKPHRHSPAIASFYILCLLFALRTILRNNDWSNEENLFISALKVCPLNAKVHYNIAKVSADNNKKDVAIAEYKAAIDLNQNYEQAMNNLANLLREDKQFREAELLLRKALSIRPNFSAAWMNLGIVLTNLNQSEEAENCYLTALSFRKKYPDCYYNLGNLYLDLKRNEEALKAWEMAVLYRPKHTAAWSNMLVLLDTLKSFDSVQELANVALMHNPTSAALHFCLANTLGKVKQFEKAEKHFLEALNLNADNALYYSNLGVLYHRWKKPKKAIQMYRKALHIDPRMVTAESNLRKLINM